MITEGDFPALPPALRASRPSSERVARRDQVRMLVIDRASESIIHSRFDQVGQFLGEGDLLVVNTSRMVPSAVAAQRAGGEVVQLRPCVRRIGWWEALVVQPASPFENVPLEVGEELRVGEIVFTVTGQRPDIPFLWRLSFDGGDGLDLLLRCGQPIRYSYVPDPVDLDQYQTVYATHPGSAESPSAGQPFSWELLSRLRGLGVGLADIVLHTGLSSYQDDKFDAEHHLYEEWFEVSAATAAAVGRARRVVAVGTTVVRALETAGGRDGAVRPVGGWTDLAIGDQTRLRVVDSLITGLHEPQASHFNILRALVEPELLLRAYVAAIGSGYLWHEFGDSLLIV